MNKQDIINEGYKYVSTQNSESKMELWAKFNGCDDTIVYLFYIPETDTVIEQSKHTVSYLQLDMMSQIRDKMKSDFLNLNVKYDKSCVWIPDSISDLNAEWNKLSDEAKNIIEWVENPFTNKKENIEIQVGTNFQRNMLMYTGDFCEKCDIPITMRLFSEIINYVSNDNNLETVSYDANTNKYVFRVKEGINLH